MNAVKLGRAGAIVATFVVIGPLIGLFAVSFFSFFAVGFSSGFSGAWAVPAFLLIYGWLFAHLMGALPALVAGVLVAGYAARYGRVPLWLGAASGLASAALLAATSGYGLRGSLSINGVGDGAFMAIWPATHVAAAMACTALTRRWQ